VFFAPYDVTITSNERYNDGTEDIAPNIIRVTLSRRKSWARTVAGMVEGEVHIGFWWGNIVKESRRRTRYKWEN
jgi:hypothetical protein